MSSKHEGQEEDCHWALTMLPVLLLSVAPLLAVAQQPAEISDEDLKSINEANNLDLK